MSEHIEACPFCGSYNLKVKSSERWGWFVSCECAAVGPSAGGRLTAIQKWNTRVKPMQGRLELQC